MVWITHYQIKKTLWLKIVLNNNILQVEMTLITHDSPSGVLQRLKNYNWAFINTHHPDVSFPDSERQTTAKEEMTVFFFD